MSADSILIQPFCERIIAKREAMLTAARQGSSTEMDRRAYAWKEALNWVLAELNAPVPLPPPLAVEE